MKNIIIGQFVPGTSFLYKMDPRSKLLALIIFMVSTFIFKELGYMLVLLAGVLVILKLGGIPIGRIIKGLRPIVILLTFTFTFQLLFVKTGDPVYSPTLTLSTYTLVIMIAIILIWFFTKRYIKMKFIYFLLTVFAILYMLSEFTLGAIISTTDITIYSDGISGAFFIMVRLIIIITMSTILTLTTKPTDLNLGLEKIMKPLHYIGINSEEIAMIISIALRYIPTLLDEANKIILAQASRGVDFSEGKFKDKVVQIISLLVPMFIISFNRSDELANAMEARNLYQENQEREYIS